VLDYGVVLPRHIRGLRHVPAFVDVLDHHEADEIII
jgi:hypothetical protein